MQEKFAEFGSLAIAFGLYPLLASFALRIKHSFKWTVLASLGIVLTYITGLTLTYPVLKFAPSQLASTYSSETKLFFVYLALVAVSYVALRQAVRNSRLRSLAYLTPILCIAAARDVIPALEKTQRHSVVFVIFLGVSYAFFRLCLLTNEVLNEVASMPSVAQYFAFAFYVPLVFVGPISKYSSFLESINVNKKVDYVEACYRISIGLVKYIVLSSALAEFSYGPAFLRDGHLHSKVDLLLAMTAYPLFLYCNFSGMCDVAIGISSLLGITIEENFNHPFSARNLQEFWTRWHITLSSWMRDLVFTPLVKLLARRFGTKAMEHYIAIAIIAVFVAIGAWHAPTSHFILFGFSHGVGVAFVHYGNLFCKRRMSKEQFKAFKQSQRLKVLGSICTYAYFAATLFLFANTFQDASEILHHLA